MGPGAAGAMGVSGLGLLPIAWGWSLRGGEVVRGQSLPRSPTGLRELEKNLGDLGDFMPGWSRGRGLSAALATSMGDLELFLGLQPFFLPRRPRLPLPLPSPSVSLKSYTSGLKEDGAGGGGPGTRRSSSPVSTCRGSVSPDRSAPPRPRPRGAPRMAPRPRRPPPGEESGGSTMVLGWGEVGLPRFLAGAPSKESSFISSTGSVPSST